MMLDLNSVREVTPSQLDKSKRIVDQIVCEWSMKHLHALTEAEQTDLVDRMAPLFAKSFNAAFADGAQCVMQFVEEKIRAKK